MSILTHCFAQATKQLYEAQECLLAAAAFVDGKPNDLLGTSRELGKLEELAKAAAQTARLMQNLIYQEKQR
jgi:hypothetical protein